MEGFTAYRNSYLTYTAQRTVHHLGITMLIQWLKDNRLAKVLSIVLLLISIITEDFLHSWAYVCLMLAVWTGGSFYQTQKTLADKENFSSGAGKDDKCEGISVKKFAEETSETLEFCAAAD